MGGLILAVSGLLLLFLCVSGIVLWWPGIRRMARGFQVRRGKGAYTFNYDLHNVVGIAVLPLLAMWAITGTGFELKQVRDAWYAVLPGGQPAEMEEVTSEPGSGPGISMERAEQIALAKVPGSRPVSISVPDAKAKDSAYFAYVASGSDPYDHSSYPGNVGVGVDRYSGRAEITYDNRDGPVAQVWEDWQYPPTPATSWAGGYRTVWLVFGFLPLVLAVTGVTTWWHAPAQAPVRDCVSESFNSAVAMYAAGLGLWALVWALRGAGPSRGQLAAVVVLELALIAQSACACA